MSANALQTLVPNSLRVPKFMVKEQRLEVEERPLIDIPTKLL